MGLNTPTPEQLVGWTPIRLGWVDGELVADWCYTAGHRFDDPFFDQTVQRCLREPFRLLFRHQTPMATLGQVVAAGDALRLAGLILHCSRCGSTLVSQMLGCLPSVVALSEPGPVQSILSLGRDRPGAVSDDRRVDWLRWMVAALGQRRQPEQQALVVKMDAWAVLDLPLLLRAFPTTPWIFVYRDPVEVLVSHQDLRGYHMIPGTLPPASLGLDGGASARIGTEEYIARVLAVLLEAPAECRLATRPLLVNYRELPGAVANRIAPWFGLDVESDDVAQMTDVAQRDAKNPYVGFQDDIGSKQERASEAVREAVARWVEVPYQVLESQWERHE